MIGQYLTVQKKLPLPWGVMEIFVQEEKSVQAETLLEGDYPAFVARSNVIYKMFPLLAISCFTYGINLQAPILESFEGLVHDEVQCQRR